MKLTTLEAFLYRLSRDYTGVALHAILDSSVLDREHQASETDADDARAFAKLLREREGDR